jgi:hypothetical protein
MMSFLKRRALMTSTSVSTSRSAVPVFALFDVLMSTLLAPLVNRTSDDDL